MPELPKTLQRSERHAQEVWLKTLESAMETYGGDNGRSRRVAFASLKHQYEKKGNRWVKKTDKGPSDPQAARGPTTRHKSTDEPRAATALAKRQKPRRRPAERPRKRAGNIVPSGPRKTEKGRRFREEGVHPPTEQGERREPTDVCRGLCHKQ